MVDIYLIIFYIGVKKDKYDIISHDQDFIACKMMTFLVGVPHFRCHESHVKQISTLVIASEDGVL